MIYIKYFFVFIIVEVAFFIFLLLKFILFPLILILNEEKE